MKAGTQKITTWQFQIGFDDFFIPETHSHQASENKWLEDDSFPLGIWPIFRGSSPVVSGRVHRLHDTHP